jgi:hypothetical protein
MMASGTGIACRTREQRNARDSPSWATGALVDLVFSDRIGRFGVVGRVLIRLEGRLAAPGRRLRAASLTFVTPLCTFSVNFLISKQRNS